ncbi:MAG: energy-coupled thiamine transporter ThiT, partial [Selenomonadaceae bacterium]|nr:energy-coupled thiamine transporter ThiT [Selenomonadaceae bacterium]
IFLSTLLAFCGRFLCHFISGVIFFASYAPEGISPIIYSITANATYLVPELIITCLILKILPVQRLLDTMDKH